MQQWSVPSGLTGRFFSGHSTLGSEWAGYPDHFLNQRKISFLFGEVPVCLTGWGRKKATSLKCWQSGKWKEQWLTLGVRAHGTCHTMVMETRDNSIYLASSSMYWRLACKSNWYNSVTLVTRVQQLYFQNAHCNLVCTVLLLYSRHLSLPASMSRDLYPSLYEPT